MPAARCLASTPDVREAVDPGRHRIETAWYVVGDNVICTFYIDVLVDETPSDLSGHASQEVDEITWVLALEQN